MSSIHIALVGFKHTGKTQHGRALAQALGFRFLDTDALIQELDATESGMRRTVRDIYLEDGRERFQQLEATSCRLAAEMEESSVVATGGGLCENQPALGALEGFVFVHLVDSLESISHRIFRAGIPAFLHTTSADEAERRLAELYTSRVRAYDDLAAMKLDLSGMSLAEARNKVIASVEEHLGR